MVRARKLRHKITIQSVTQSTDARGGPTETFSTYAIRRAEIKPLSGREYFANQQVQSQSSIWFKVRYDNTTKRIDPTYQVSYDSRIFDIESVINVDEKDQELVLMCVEQH